LQALGFERDGQEWAISTPTTRISVKCVDHPPAYVCKFRDRANRIEDVTFFDQAGEGGRNASGHRDLLAWAVHYTLTRAAHIPEGLAKLIHRSGDLGISE
jgi:hypothetical protein